MNDLGTARFVGWRLIASTLIALPVIAAAQGRPQIVWANGGHSDSVNSIAYSLDGQSLVSGSSDRTIKLWSKDGAFIRSFVIPYDSNAQLSDVLSVAILPDGGFIAAGVEQYNAGSQTYFGAVQIWRISDGVLVQNFTGYGAAVNSVAFSPDGQYVVSGSEDRSVKVWRLANGTLVSNRSDHLQNVTVVAFSNDGRWLATASNDSTANIYRTSDWGLERTFTGHTNSILDLAFSPNSASLATGSLDQTIRVWKIADGSVMSILNHGSAVYSVAFAPDGKTLASGAWDKSIKLWDPKPGMLINTLLGHTGAVLTLAFAPDSETLASGSWYPEFAIRLWGSPRSRLLSTVTNHSSSISELIFTADSRVISAGDVTARFWQGSNGGFLSAINPGSSVGAMAISPNGQLIAMPGSNHTVKIYRSSDDALVQTLIGHTDDVTGLAFSHDGTLLASGAFFNGTNDSIKLWSVANWTVVRELTGQFIFGPFIAINFSPNDTFISATCEGTPAVWRVSNGALVRTFPLGSLTRFSPNGMLLAVASDPVRVYRTSDWMQVATLSDQNQALAFTPDGSYLATAGRSRIQFWRLSDWTMQFFYDQEMGYPGFGVSSLAFSPDGSRFAYGRWDAVVALARSPFSLVKCEIK